MDNRWKICRKVAFHWYVDKGVFLNTGLTTGTFVSSSSEDEWNEESTNDVENLQIGTTVVTNTLRIDADFEGPLRFWVVAHYN